MTEPLLIVFAAGSLVPLPIIIVAILIVALIILGGAIYAKRSSKKNASAASGSSTDWQRQAQPGAWNNQQGSAAGWGQNAQQAGWNAQGQQNSWSGTPGQNNTPQQNPWGAPGAQAQMQQPQNPWGAPGADQNPWGSPAAQPQAQQAQNPWGSPAAQPQAQPAQNPWGNQGMPSAWGNEAAPAAAPASQDAWGQTPSTGSSQQWGAQPMGGAGNVNQQPNSLAGTGNTSGQAWGQQPPQQANPWNAQAPAQQASFGGAGAANPPSMSSWQQAQGGYGQQAGNFGGQDQTAYYQDNDKTVVRPGGAPQPAPMTSMGYVRVEEGKEPGRIYEIRKESLSIGRSRESDIFLEDLAVSRLHASIVNLGNGNYALKDEGSANGTKVNGQLVNKFQTYPLQEGDRIQLGQTVLVFARK